MISIIIQNGLQKVYGVAVGTFFYLAPPSVFVIGFPAITLIFLILFLIKKVRKTRCSVFREILKYLFALYIVLAASLTLFPIGIPNRGLNSRFYLVDINLVPFKSMTEIFFYFLKHDFSLAFRLKMIFINIGGNLLLLMPLGFLSPIFFNRCRTLLSTLLLAFIVSSLVETLQLFEQILKIANRATDIDDVILNVAGAAIGFLLYRLSKRVLNSIRVKAPEALQ